MECPRFSATLALGAATSVFASVLLSIAASEPAYAGDFDLVLDGTPINERLDANDDYLVEDNSYIDTYSFEGQAGQRVVITMTSQQLDSYLLLLDPNGNSIAQDDDSAGNLDAQIDVVLPVSGTYTIYANSYNGGVVGAYTIQAATTSSPASPSNVTSTQPASPSSTASASASASSSTQSRYFCDGSGDIPLTMARSRRTGDTFPLIQWTSDWAPAPYSPGERCQTVSSRLEAVHSQFDRLILTAGTWNGQPVVCAATSREDARQGVCATDGLVLTTRYRDEAEELIRGLQTSFTRIVAGTSPDILPASSAVNEGTPYIDIGDF
ncbi:MAG: hypothetical protein Kow00121_00290 [Elainellaceae cyanobacterium]